MMNKEKNLSYDEQVELVMNSSFEDYFKKLLSNYNNKDEKEYDFVEERKKVWKWMQDMYKNNDWSEDKLKNVKVDKSDKDEIEMTADQFCRFIYIFGSLEDQKCVDFFDTLFEKSCNYFNKLLLAVESNKASRYDTKL